MELKKQLKKNMNWRPQQEGGVSLSPPSVNSYGILRMALLDEPEGYLLGLMASVTGGSILYSG